MSSGTPGQVARAVDVEVGRLALFRARCWQWLGVATAVASVFVFVGTQASGGSVGMALGLVFIGWFTLVRARIERPRWRPFLDAGTALIEMSAPWILYASVAVLADATAAVSSWGPAFLYCGILTLSILKLSARYTLVMGVVGAVLYLGSSLLIGANHVALSMPGTTEAVFVRAAFVVIAAGVVAVVSRGLRGAMGGVVSTVRANDLFGKYRLEKKLAEGGMGVVWLATYCPEGGFARPAAVKLVHPHLAKDPEFVEGFRREAELGARLVHSHIVQTFDFGRVDDRYFLAMEFVDGITLRDLMKRAAAANRIVPPVVAGAIARGVLAGLGYAHGEARDPEGNLLRVIHRDLAPSNILIAKSGAVKVTDFGIARALRDRPSEETETVAGHFDHMAPEQADAAPLDERADLFCAGILLWEMLTGRLLFRRNNDVATLRAIALDPIPAPSTVDPALASWDALFERALARDPAQRFRTATSMAEAVRALTGDGGDDVIARFLTSLPEEPAPHALGPGQTAQTVPVRDRSARTDVDHDVDNAPTSVEHR